MSDEPRTVDSAVGCYALSMKTSTRYKSTEIGVLPQEWNIARLGAIAAIRTGHTPPTRDAANYGTEYPFIGPSDIDGAKYVTKTEKMLSRKGFAISQRLPPNSILFVCIGSVGKCAIAPMESTSNQQITAVLPSASFSTDYLYYAICSVAPRIKALAGKQVLPIVNKTQFSTTVVPLPTLAEQTTIADALSESDSLIRALEVLIAKKRAIKRATMQQLLTGRTRLPGFSETWAVRQLVELVDVDPENLPSHTNPEYRFNYISLEDVSAGRLLGYKRENFRTAPSRARRVLRCDDVLMSTVRPTLRAHLLFREQWSNAVCSTGFAVLRSKRGSSVSGFVFQHLFGHIVNEQIERILAGSNYPAITSRDVQLIEIPCPPWSEQRAIATVLSDMDAEIAVLEQRLDKTRAIKQGMMQQLLTGRVRLVEPAATAVP